MAIERVENHPDGERAKRELSSEHLEALAQGRKESAVVRRYLEALTTHRPKRGRKPDKDRLTERLKALEERIRNGTDNPATRLGLIQERKDIESRLSTFEQNSDLKKFEDEFVRVAASYAHRRGIDYSSFKELGVPPEVLKRAGLSRGGVGASNAA